MKEISFTFLHEQRKKFLRENASVDHKVIEGAQKVLISAPHGVSQVRLGKLKYKEIGSLTTALFLQKATDSYLIAKTQNNNDDANFDEKCSYRKRIEKLIELHNIKYLIDIHGLSHKRGCDVNLGVNLGKNVETNSQVLKILQNKLIDAGFFISIDNPFMGGGRTIAGGMKNRFPSLWTIQVEINCAITNKAENFDKFEKLLTVLTDWIEILY